VAFVAASPALHA
jgi:hypothetical protein